MYIQGILCYITLHHEIGSVFSRSKFWSVRIIYFKTKLGPVAKIAILGSPAGKRTAATTQQIQSSARPTEPQRLLSKAWSQILYLYKIYKFNPY